ncbi:hypothetical protein [Halomonas korlensis]|uniref:Uncharacterized protein n=1 Tax=Halomonas korlensis TaxID=463301 RepID=A0A1I7G0S9_9GAMM|nr:hypothetical protein [Halomonas korlensis]SFU42054.1 hypothetical protein SAMN04487955_102158 [Halomonas korlensis]
MFEQAFKNIAVIVANPTFGGKSRKAVLQNFSIKTGELTARQAEAAVEEATA